MFRVVRRTPALKLVCQSYDKIQTAAVFDFESKFAVQYQIVGQFVVDSAAERKREVAGGV